MNTDELYNKEQVTWRRYYEYKCVFCKVKRKTRKHSIALGRWCKACIKRKLEDAHDKRQLKLFI